GIEMASVDNELEEVMAHLGEFGKFQAWQFSLHIIGALTAGLHMMTLMTVAAVPEAQCEITPGEYSLYGNGSGEGFEVLDKCHFVDPSNETRACSLWSYDRTYFQSSRAIEWNFVCSQRWMGALAQSAYMFGVFVGAVSLGSMADKYGRKIIFYVSSVAQLVLGVSVALIPEYYSFLVVRFLYGIFGSAGAYITGFVLTMELVGASKRTVCGLMFQLAFAKALRMNGSPVQLDVQKYAAKGKVKEISGEGDVDGSHSALDLLKTPNLRAKTLNVCLNWFANSIVYYGLSLNTGNLVGNPFLMIAVGIVLFGKACIAGSFAIIYNYTAELFPTVLRNTALGIGSMCARLSGALTPMIMLLDSFNPKVPATVFGFIALLAGFLALYLPETVNQPMPESLEDGENFGKGDTCFSSCINRRRVKDKRAYEVALQKVDDLEHDKDYQKC
ncbi:hypothetical protein TSAR_000893, partial [Trichomalopsis sarcophagae]